MINQNPILQENEISAIEATRERLLNRFGKRLKHLILFGSKARGEATAGSDLDLLVVIENLENPREARRQIIHDTCSIDLEHNVLLSPKAVDADYFRDATAVPFYIRVKADGVRL